ncbi:MAG: molybdenum cofactor guanylyltransferase [Promethearchaeota archaeon]|nr:MAG: molybdenum cofactor guanylyltransferase [Candidatus Lokiarchaeota archaeon]
MSNIIKRNKYIAFVILIGGRSARFGNDKGLHEFLGKPLISYQLDILTQFDIDIFLVANSKTQVGDYIDKIDYEQISAFIVDDNQLIKGESIRSPMIGLYTAFKELKPLNYEKAFALSCDMPLIKANVINLLINEAKKYDCCIPKWKNHYLEPLFAVYPISKALERIKKILRNNKLKLLNIIDEEWNIRYISIENEISVIDPELVSFVNINRISDLNALSEKFQKNE